MKTRSQLNGMKIAKPFRSLFFMSRFGSFRFHSENLKTIVKNRNESRAGRRFQGYQHRTSPKHTSKTVGSTFFNNTSL
jgi:hypothetical protein